MNVTAGMALKLIPEKLSSQPVFLCIDDTMASKFGKKFEDVSKLFDHAAHYNVPIDMDIKFDPNPFRGH